MAEKNAQNVFHHPSRTLLKLFLKLGTALLVGPAENCPINTIECHINIINSETVLGFVRRSPNP